MIQYKKSNNEWVIRFRPVTTPRLRLFCFPYAGGNAALFRAWSVPRMLPEGVEVCAIELPGHGVRQQEDLCIQFSQVLDAVTAALLPLVQQESDVPFAFLGCSLGALLAFEGARRLQEVAALTPSRLIVVACTAPQRPQATPEITNVAELLAYLNVLGSYPSASMIERRWELFHADFAVRSSYEYREGMILSCPITAIGGEHDGSILASDLTAWKTQTSNDFTLYLMPGNHFFFQENQRQFVQLFSSSLLMN